MWKLRCLRAVIRMSCSGLRAAPTCRSLEDSRSSSTKDLAFSDVVDELLMNPITVTSSIIYLSPDGKEALRDKTLSPLTVAGLQGYRVSVGVAIVSYADIMKRGIHLKEVDEPGTCGAVTGLEVFRETEQLGLPGLNPQPRLGPSYQVVTDDHQDGDPSSCANLGRLKRNLKVIRKQFNASRARPNGDDAIPRTRQLYSGGEQNLHVGSMDSPPEGMGPKSKKPHRPKKKCSPHV
ncbi:hypothetical protein Nepgr_030806 [Nepenthes gracilis]|uniref:Uncharacterized protein n=1 Tax=Nepenthes gracilis TaxID=150966 RepID=A0AAD3Y4K9_NEPGR|nr:hypothetical protein Nepgr_030806 [Nepenthes gracilis]